MSESDEALAVRARAGERAAFGELLGRHYPQALALCRRLLGDGHEAEDLAQEAAISSYLGLGRLRDPGRFGAWLCAIAANLARQALRRRRPLPLPAEGEGNIVLLWSAQPSPEEVALMRELHDTVVAALGEMSPLSREAVVGFYLQGYSYAELAALLNVPVGTLKGRLVFGRRQLRGRLGHLAGERPAHAPQRSGRKEQPVSQPEPIPAVIDSVRLNTRTQHRVVVLRERDGERSLPIWIGPVEADAISIALAGQQLPRPMTHDLSLRLLAPRGSSRRRVTITRIADNTFFADVEVQAGGSTYTVDARPSDALALAVRADAPIFVAPEVLEQAALVLIEAGESVPLEPGAPPPRPTPLLLIGAEGEVADQLARLLFLSVSNADITLLPAAQGADDMAATAALAASLRGALVVANLGEPIVLDQLAALRSLRPELRAIVLGPDEPALRERAAAAGALSYLVKPVEAADLHRAALAALLP